MRRPRAMVSCSTMSIKRTVAMSLSLVPLVVACTGGVPTPEPAPTAPQTAVQTPEGEPAWVVTNGVTWVRQFNEPEVELTGVEARFERHLCHWVDRGLSTPLQRKPRDIPRC